MTERTSSAATLVELFQSRAAKSPDAIAYAFVTTSNEINISFGELDRKMRRTAAWLQARHLTAPTLLVYPPGLEFVIALGGCLYAGIVAIPVPIPERQSDIERFCLVVADSEAVLALTTFTTLGRLNRSPFRAALLSACKWFATDRLDEVALVSDHPIIHAGETTAYVQYTSGSTTEPKGVIISHGNVLHNLACIDDAFKHKSNDISVTWLPHFHDMGLVYGILAPLYGNFKAVLMAPAAFLQSPMFWLETISRCRATHSGAPNFAFDLCVRRIRRDDLLNLDLDTWRVAFNGAERVRSETIDRFADMFGICGFRRSSFFPAYGLAESTLVVSCKTSGAAISLRHLHSSYLEQHRVVHVDGDDPAAYAVIACGAVSHGTRVVMVHPVTNTECEPGELGEIWVSGPSVAHGYLRRPDETQRTFRARLPNGDDEFVRTGDLGFVEHGELFVTGRLKDLIIIRGRNYYPDDIEATVAKSHEAMQPNAAAAFAVDIDGEECLVVVQEVRRGWNGNLTFLHELVTRRVAEAHELHLHDLVFVKLGTVPRTSSGKIKRHLCRSYFLEGRLNPVMARHAIANTSAPSHEPSGPRQAGIVSTESNPITWLQDEVARILGIVPVSFDTEKPLTAFGLDSLAASDLVWAIERTWGVVLSVADLLRGMTLQEIASFISDCASNTGGITRTLIPFVNSCALAPLTAEQERLWVMEQSEHQRGTYNIAAAIIFQGRLEMPILERCLAELVTRHDALRASFSSRHGQPIQKFSGSAFLQMRIVDHLEASREHLQVAIERECQQPIELDPAPLARVVLIRGADDEHILVLIAHHIIADAHSLRLLRSEIVAMYKAFSLGEPSPLTFPKIKFSDFAWWHRQQLRTPAFSASRRFWREQLATLPPRLSWPSANRLDVQRKRCSGRYSFSLPGRLREQLANRCRQEQVTPFMWLLTVFALLLYRYTGQNDVLVGSPSGGRHRLETTDVVGFLAHPTVFRLTVGQESTFLDLVRRTKVVALQVYTNSDVPFSTLVKIGNPRCNDARAPLLQAMLTFLKGDNEVTYLPSVTMSMLDVPPADTDFELCVSLVEYSNGIQGYVQYDTRFFNASSAALIARLLQDILERSISVPQLPLDHSTAQDEIASRDHDQSTSGLVVTSTFEARPVEESLRFWLRRLEMSHAIAIVPANLTVQQLLDSRSRVCENRNGVNAVLVRLDDWDVAANLSLAFKPSGDEFRQFVDQFCIAVRGAVERTNVPFIVVFCPASKRFHERWDGPNFAITIEEAVKADLEVLSDVVVVTSSELLETYPVEHLHDDYADVIAGLPYTKTFFTALGTMIVRKMFVLTRPRRKVIALDCDQTLWKGVCSEDGALGVIVDPARRALQEFMLEQHQAGMLLCLCSKNHPDNVEQVFLHRHDLVLRRDHFVAARINWKPKSENLRLLASELHLGLNSFIFIDDDAAECAEVQANCPEVLTLQLPKDDGMVATFLRHVWAFDKLKVTREDKLRSTMYLASAARERTRASFQTLQDFLASLNLVVETREASTRDLERVAQLTQRTNYFNVTTRRRTAREIGALQTAGSTCFVTEARDRFGDYGIVGGLIIKGKDDALLVDTFVLSCRALGKGIEHQMMQTLFEFAIHHNLRVVVLPFVETTRNEAARTFLESLGAASQSTTTGCALYKVDVTRAVEVA